LIAAWYKTVACTVRKKEEFERARDVHASPLKSKSAELYTKGSNVAFFSCPIFLADVDIPIFLADVHASARLHETHQLPNEKN